MKFSIKTFVSVLSIATSAFAANWTGDTSEPTTTQSGDTTFYAISSAEELAWFAEQVNEGNTTINAKLLNDITLWSADVCDTCTTTMWTPIANKFTLAYKGVFDGDGFTISGIHIRDSLESTSDSLFVGLFGVLDSVGVIRNVKVDNSFISSYSTSTSVLVATGGIVGYSEGTLERLVFNDTIRTNGGALGGIVGYASGNVRIKSCVLGENAYVDHTKSDLGGDNYAGGIAGYVKGDGYVNRCANNGGTIYGANTKIPIGGIVGQVRPLDNDTTPKFVLEGNTNQGYLYGTAGKAGGIVGLANGASIVSSTNIGKIGGRFSSAGGIVGIMYSSSINASYNESSDSLVAITSSSSAGGIVGKALNSTIYGCSNRTPVVAYMAGGIAGHIENESRIDSSFNKGTVRGNNSRSVGGIVGNSNNGYYSRPNIIRKCQNSGEITGRPNPYQYSKMGIIEIGGIAGSATYTLIESCMNYGNVEASATYADTALSNHGYEILAGGILGTSGAKEDTTTIVKSANYGIVKSTAGRHSIDMSNASALYAGGISGYMRGFIEDSYNQGNVESYLMSDSFTVNEIIEGGIVGNFKSGYGKNIYNTGSITHSTYAPGQWGQDTSYNKSTPSLGALVGSFLQSGFKSVNMLTNAYFLDSAVVGAKATGVNDSGYVVSVFKRSEAELKTDSAAWQLNTAYGTEKNSGIWTHNSGYPEFASGTSAGICRVTFLDYDEKLTYFKQGAISYPETSSEGIFIGWGSVDGVIGSGSVACDTTLQAYYQVEGMYTVRFLDRSETELFKLMTEIGGKLSEIPDAPAADEGEYFNGWYSGDILLDSTTVLTENTSFIATYGLDAERKFVVVFLDADSSTLLETETLYNELPECSGCSPSLASNDSMEYTFTGWTPDIVAATENATYMAVYDSAVREYKVTFMSDGEVLAEKTYAYGDSVMDLEKEPTKNSTATTMYHFVGWDSEFERVTGDQTYTAVFDSSTHFYTIQFVMGDSILMEYVFRYGDSVAYDGEEPTKAETEFYTYQFAGWSPALDVVSDDAVYTAVFDSTAKKRQNLVQASAVSTPMVSVDGMNLNIQGLKSGSLIHVFDMQGRIITRQRTADSSLCITLPIAGSYIVKVNNVMRIISLK